MMDVLDILAQGGVAVYPTETLYALGCVATSHEAARRVAAIKGRPEAKPLPLIIGNLGQLGLVTHDAGGDLLGLAEAFWPGPVSLLVRAHEELSPLVRDEDGYTSVRVTSHPTAARLCAQLGMPLVAMCEGYAFAAKAGIDLQTTFEATRCGFVGGPMYENKVPKIIHRDYEPGARIAVHRKDILNAKHYAHKLGIDLPMTDVVLHVMDWMNDNGHIDDDQAAMVKYYEEKMGVTVGSAPDGAETL